MSSTRLHEWLKGGPAVIVATVDADGVPAACRGIAFTAKDDLQTVTVYLPAATAHETLANLATTRRLAVAACHPLTHSTVQVKGVTLSVKLAPASDEDLVRTHWHAFTDVLDVIGLPRRVTHRIAYWPAFAVEMSVEQVFDQTPGPNAGVAIA